MNNNEWQTLISIPADFVRRRWQFQFPYFISDNMVPSAATQSSPSLNIRSQTVTATHKAKPKSANNKIPIPLCEWSEKPKLRKKRFAMERQQTTQKKMFISLICVCVCVSVWCFGCSRSRAAPKSNSICFIRSTTKLDFSEVDVRCSHIRINTSLRSRSTVIRGFSANIRHASRPGLALTHTNWTGWALGWPVLYCVRAVYCSNYMGALQSLLSRRPLQR